MRCLIGAIIVLHEAHLRLVGYILVFYDGLEHRLDFCELLLVSLLVRHDELAVRRDELAVRRHCLIQSQYRGFDAIDLVLRVVSAFMLSQRAARPS